MKTLLLIIGFYLVIPCAAHSSSWHKETIAKQGKWQKKQDEKFAKLVTKEPPSFSPILKSTTASQKAILSLLLLWVIANNTPGVAAHKAESSYAIKSRVLPPQSMVQTTAIAHLALPSLTEICPAISCTHDEKFASALELFGDKIPKKLSLDELLHNIKLSTEKLRAKTYGPHYGYKITKKEEKRIFEIFEKFLPKLKDAIDSALAKGNKVGLILGELHSYGGNNNQKYDYFNQLISVFAKEYLTDLRFYSEGSKKYIEKANELAKDSDASLLFDERKNQFDMWSVTKSYFFSNLGLKVLHTENIANRFFIERPLITTAAEEIIQFVKESPGYPYSLDDPTLFDSIKSLERYKIFFESCPVAPDARNRSIAKTISQEAGNFIAIFGRSHLPSLHEKFNRDNMGYIFVSDLTKTEDDDHRTSKAALLRFYEEFFNVINRPDCVEKISKFVLMDFKNYWNHKNVFTIKL